MAGPKKIFILAERLLQVDYHRTFVYLYSKKMYLRVYHIISYACHGRLVATGGPEHIYIYSVVLGKTLLIIRYLLEA